jgi:hypothetical protein
LQGQNRAVIDLTGATSSASGDFRRTHPRRTGLRPTTRAEAAFSLRCLPGRERGTLFHRMLFGASRTVGFPVISRASPF